MPEKPDYKRVFICRPTPGLAAVAADYPGAHLWPIADVEPLPVSMPQGTDLLVLTSANAIPAVVGTSIPIAAVGPQTAAAARAAGLTVALEGPGTVAGLCPLLQQNPARRLCHVHGDPAQLDWHQAIQPPQEIAAVCGYRTIYKTTISPDILAALRAEPAPMLTIWSPAAAHHLHRMLKQVMIDTNKCVAVCLSPAVAAAAQTLTARITVAAAPNRQAMWKKVTENVQNEKNS